MVILQVTAYNNVEIGAVYERIEELLDKETNGKDYTLVLGDWNIL